LTHCFFAKDVNRGKYFIGVEPIHTRKPLRRAKRKQPEVENGNSTLEPETNLSKKQKLLPTDDTDNIENTYPSEQLNYNIFSLDIIKEFPSGEYYTAELSDQYAKVLPLKIKIDGITLEPGDSLQLVSIT